MKVIKLIENKGETLFNLSLFPINKLSHFNKKRLIQFKLYRIKENKKQI